MIWFSGLSIRLGRLPLALTSAFGHDVTVVYCFYLECKWTRFRKQIPVAKTLEPGALEFCGTLSFLLSPQSSSFDLQAFIGDRNLVVYDSLIWQKNNLVQSSLFCFMIETSFRDFFFFRRLNHIY